MFRSHAPSLYLPSPITVKPFLNMFHRAPNLFSIRDFSLVSLPSSQNPTHHTPSSSMLPPLSEILVQYFCAG